MLLAAAAVAVAMLAVSGSAWGQGDAAQGDGEQYRCQRQGRPRHKAPRPRPGEKVEDRTPTIKAKVFDRDGDNGRNDDELRKQDIKLKVDNDRVKQRDFSYSRRKELLAHPGQNLCSAAHRQDNGRAQGRQGHKELVVQDSKGLA